jgi:glycosyltransferase involved in cell wall biosynthesis
MNSPIVSVIIGAYNCATFLPGLFTCLDAQTFRDFEVIVVDDASTDGKTLSALEAMGDKIRLIKRSVNSGTCELPRYQGVKAASAPLCAFLDADDRWDPAFLEECHHHMVEHPEEALVHTYARIIDGEDRVQRIRHEGVMPVGPDVPRALLRHCFITISAVVARRDLWLAALKEAEITDFGMDQDFFLSIARRHPIGFIPEVLASYRRSDYSVSVKKWKRAPRNVNTLERILDKGYWQGLVTRAEMRSIVAEAYVEDAAHWRAVGQRDRARWFVREGLRRYPACVGLWKQRAALVLRRR